LPKKIRVPLSGCPSGSGPFLCVTGIIIFLSVWDGSVHFINRCLIFSLQVTICCTSQFLGIKPGIVKNCHLLVSSRGASQSYISIFLLKAMIYSDRLSYPHPTHFN
jgi:hypothetical protein